MGVVQETKHERSRKMMFNYDKLKGKIKEKFGTQENFAKAMELSNTSVSFKLNNKSEWSQQEISKAARLLEIADNEISLYFFAALV